MSQPDLTPSPPDLKSQATRQNKSWQKKTLYGGILAVILAGLGVLLFITLSGASLFFLDVDEAVQRREELGSERFRVQGITVPETINKEADVTNPDTGEKEVAVVFKIAFNGEIVNVIHRGNTANIFTDCLPVILEGRWVSSNQNRAAVGGASYYFASTEMLVKHDNNYIPPDDEGEEGEDSGAVYNSQNPDRIDDAVGGLNSDPLRSCPQT